MELRLLEVDEAPRCDTSDRAAGLARHCLHVEADSRLVTLGYHFFRLVDSEIPVFFCKRFAADDRYAAITLIGGVDPRTGDGLLDDCVTAQEAVARLTDGQAGCWRVRLTYGARTLTIGDLTEEIARERPRVFAAIADQLEALGPSLRATCPLCRDC
jgi:hypothetical protein